MVSCVVVNDAISQEVQPWLIKIVSTAVSK